MRCSTFLAVLMGWQAVNGLPHAGLADDPLAWTAVRRRLRDWRFVGRVNDLNTFVRPGQVVCVLRDAAVAVQLFVAARTRLDFQAVVADLGVPIEEL